MPTVLTHICDFCDERAVSALRVKVTHGQDHGTTRTLLVCNNHRRWLTEELGDAPSPAQRYDFHGKIKRKNRPVSYLHLKPEESQNLVLETLKGASQPLSTNDLSQITTLSRGVIRRALDHLVAKGFIAQTGKSRATRYHVVDVVTATPTGSYPEEPSPSVTTNGGNAVRETESDAIGGVPA